MLNLSSVIVVQYMQILNHYVVYLKLLIYYKYAPIKNCLKIKSIQCLKFWPHLLVLWVTPTVAQGSVLSASVWLTI